MSFYLSRYDVLPLSIFKNTNRPFIVMSNGVLSDINYLCDIKLLQSEVL